jgi:hypothetical protein
MNETGSKLYTKLYTTSTLFLSPLSFHPPTRRDTTQGELRTLCKK